MIKEELIFNVRSIISVFIDNCKDDESTIQEYIIDIVDTKQTLENFVYDDKEKLISFLSEYLSKEKDGNKIIKLYYLDKNGVKKELNEINIK